MYSYFKKDTIFAFKLYEITMAHFVNPIQFDISYCIYYLKMNAMQQKIRNKHILFEIYLSANVLSHLAR